ncbi:hypothetical protein PHYPSEUDO_009112 [Phytophthora pseudosyringae]|uniref:Uncharacterized protein n=1 Tax=Phytophthora pseudosyringae TaxID=221518 RepID=A0A8T1VDL4_9STRA|nr:hypothetical protein PHYPSEUDO_009112 [Phytophthora pseudosyringae]
MKVAEEENELSAREVVDAATPAALKMTLAVEQERHDLDAASATRAKVAEATAVKAREDEAVWELQNRTKRQERIRGQRQQRQECKKLATHVLTSDGAAMVDFEHRQVEEIKLVVSMSGGVTAEQIRLNSKTTGMVAGGHGTCGGVPTQPLIGDANTGADAGETTDVVRSSVRVPRTRRRFEMRVRATRRVAASGLR